MRTTLNVMFQNEEKILSQVLKYWKEYPIDHYIFYNDNSTDSSVNLIKNVLCDSDVTIINSQIDVYNESLARQEMLNTSRQLNADLMFSLDCDELLTSNILTNWEKFLNYFKTYDVELFWYNCVNESLKYYRCDPLYKRNFKSFVAPLAKIENWNIHEHKYHQRRVPYINLPKVQTEQCGVLHLQALNRKYYALKQLWYKHFEFKEYKHSINFINNRYDPVVNRLQFNEKEIDQKLIEGIVIDVAVFDQLEIEKGYLAYIKENYIQELVTFGQEYIV